MIYSIPECDRAALEGYCREELTGVPVASRALSLSARRGLLHRHGEAAASALVRHCIPDARVENANGRRNNQPGYDLILNGKYRIQVKGRCWVEMIEFGARPLSHVASWQSDLWILIDFGTLIDGCHGRLHGNDEVAPRDQIDFYVAPTRALHDLVARKVGREFRGRVKLWLGKTEKTSRLPHHTPELTQFRNAFHYLTELVA